MEPKSEMISPLPRCLAARLARRQDCNINRTRRRRILGLNCATFMFVDRTPEIPAHHVA